MTSTMVETATNVEFYGGTYMTARVINHNSARHDSIQLLLNHCAMEATHESSTAEYAPKCKPNTRVQVIGDIVDWVNQRRAQAPEWLDKPILWFSGPAGAGKTCIQREVAKVCQDAGMLVVSYFFSTRVTNLDHAKPFVFTIVQQLVEKVPFLRPAIDAAIRKSPSIFEKGLYVQVELLILNPIKTLVAEKPELGQQLLAMVRVLSIDGLDECRNVEERRRLLNVIRTLASNPILPFHVVVASRPEVDIRTGFAIDPLASLTHHIRLNDYDGSSDIRNYLCDEFARIRDTHPSKHFIPRTWPSEDDVETLVDKSSSQFIYPATVIRYVDSPRHDPVKSLQRVLDSSDKANNDNRNPFSDLDHIYHLILHPPDVDPDLLRRLLHGISVATSIPGPYSILQTKLLDKFYELEPGTTEMTLCDLHSLIDVPPDGGTLKLHHKSVQDFLHSQSRSKELCRSLDKSRVGVLQRCMFHLIQWSKGAKKDINIVGFSVYAIPALFSLISVSFWTKQHGTYARLMDGFDPSIILQAGYFDARLAIRYAAETNAVREKFREWNSRTHDFLCYLKKHDPHGSPSCSIPCKQVAFMTRHLQQTEYMLRFRSYSELENLPSLNACIKWRPSRRPCQLTNTECFAHHASDADDHLDLLPILGAQGVTIPELWPRPKGIVSNEEGSESTRAPGKVPEIVSLPMPDQRPLPLARRIIKVVARIWRAMLRLGHRPSQPGIADGPEGTKLPST